MAGISDLFNIARTAIQVNQQGLATTAHNIANIDTDGYSRQVVIQASAPPAEGVIGSGVQIEEIQRTVDTLLENQLTAGYEDLGFSTASYALLVQAEGGVGETDNSGLSYAVTEFFNALRDVATNPESPIQRTVLLSQAETLSREFTTQAQALNQIRLDANQEISRHVETVNGLATRIASLNDEIFKSESSGLNASDLRDQRGVLINDLAELVDIEQLQLSDGIGINVGGQLLVSGHHANALTTIPDVDNPPMNDVAVVRSDGSAIPISSKIQGGKIGGLLQVRDVDVVELQDRLDTLAASLVNEFNQQHQAGFALDSTTNNLFFSALIPPAPVANDRNNSTAVGTSVTITDPTLLTFQNYEVQFSSATAYSIVNASNGATVTTGSYTSGAAINYEGIDVVLTGAAATGDVFTVSVQQGAAQQFGLAVTDVDQVAASSTALGVPGDNVNALALVDLHTSQQSTLGNLTLNDYHAITIGNVGSATQQAASLLQTTTLAFDQIQGLRESVSGVSLDEELTNLLSFQRSFDASARMITVADELFQTILAMGR